MKKAKIALAKSFVKAKTDDRLFGSFVEHMGSTVYNGIYEPDHPLADEDGFRTDVLDLVKELNLSVIRYPGGNFTSGYNWEDTVGPVEQRPRRLELAWKAIEPNTFGLNEFMKWSEKAGTETMMTVNLGTRDMDQARNVVEYCNFEQGAYWCDLRREHGIKDPYKIKYWCLGNELDGNWQIATRKAEDYGHIANEAAKVMKWVDPNIECIAVGSSGSHLSTFPHWDKAVLDETYDNVEYLAMHTYLHREREELSDYLAQGLELEAQIKDTIAACDYVKAKKRSKKTMWLSLDEWNVTGDHTEKENVPWQIGSPIDWTLYSMRNVLLCTSMIMDILKYSDRIKMACQSLLVNTGPLIVTDKGGDAWRNAIFYPMLQASQYGRGEVLYDGLQCDKYDSASFTDVPDIDTVSVYNEEKGELTVFAMNRTGEDIDLTADVRDFAPSSVKFHSVMENEDLYNVRNTNATKTALSPKNVDRTEIDGGYAKAKLAKYSWNVIVFDVK